MELKQFIIHGNIHNDTPQAPQKSQANWPQFKKLKALNTTVLHWWLLVLYTGLYKQHEFYRRSLFSGLAHPQSWNKPSPFQNVARILSVCVHLTRWKLFSVASAQPISFLSSENTWWVAPLALRSFCFFPSMPVSPLFLFLSLVISVGDGSVVGCLSIISHHIIRLLFTVDAS